MSHKSVIYLLGRLLIVFGCLMVLPLFVYLYYDLQGFAETKLSAFLIPIGLCFILGLLFSAVRPKQLSVQSKEGLVICGLGWVLASIFGALPFVISGAIPNFIDAVFEAASGFTTTGSTVMTEIEGTARSVLFWRSFTHWIGGMGILSFAIAVLPKARGNSMYIMRAEAPGPKTGKVTPKISESARNLYLIYTGLTVLEALIIYFGSRITGDNIRLYDSVVTAFATAGTGGFAVKNASILGYHSIFLEWVCTVFMFLFGVNFSLYWYIFSKKTKQIFKDDEFKWYIIINVATITIITLNIVSSYRNVMDAIRDSAFAVNSCMSTTGFCTADFNKWPSLSKILLLLVMFFGCSAGSTGGGLKISRVVLYFKQFSRDIRQMARPNRVMQVKMNGAVVDDKMLRGVNSYLIIYVIVLCVSTVLVSFDNFDTTTTFTAVIACFNNIGPGLELVGPTGNYAMFSWFTKLVLIFDMLAGRLELFPIVALMSIKTWKKN